MGAAMVTERVSLVDYVCTHVHVRYLFGSRQTPHHGYELEARSVPDYNLLYVTNGRARWVIEGSEQLLGPGDLLIVPPNAPHHGGGKRFDLLSLHVLATLPGGRDAFDLLRPPARQKLETGSLLDGYLRAMMHEHAARKDGSSRFTLPRFAELVVLELFRHDASRGLLAARELNPLVAAVSERLRRELRRDFDAERSARQAGCTRQHLSRLFRRELGVSPRDYLAGLRLERAAELLRSSSLTVAAIGEQVGFRDPYYFSRCFRQRFALSPSEFRSGAENARRERG